MRFRYAWRTTLYLAKNKVVDYQTASTLAWPFLPFNIPDGMDQYLYRQPLYTPTGWKNSSVIRNYRIDDVRIPILGSHSGIDRSRAQPVVNKDIAFLADGSFSFGSVGNSGIRQPLAAICLIIILFISTSPAPSQVPDLRSKSARDRLDDSPAS